MRIETFRATLFEIVQLMISDSTFVEDSDPPPCSEENPCEELIDGMF